jgi:hypothetical protein
MLLYLKIRFPVYKVLFHIFLSLNILDCFTIFLSHEVLMLKSYNNTFFISQITYILPLNGHFLNNLKSGSFTRICIVSIHSQCS